MCSSRLSFHVSGAVLVQIAYYCIETIDSMDINPPYLCTGWTQYYSKLLCGITEPELRVWLISKAFGCSIVG